MFKIFRKIIALLLILFISCIEKNNPFINEDINIYTKDIGEVRDLALNGDTLFVATESEGIYVYKINTDIETWEEWYEDIYWGIDKNIRSIYYEKDNDMLFALDKYNNTYQGIFSLLVNDTIDHDNLIENPCWLDKNSSKFFINETTDDPELYILYKCDSSSAQCESSYAEINKVTYSPYFGINPSIEADLLEYGDFSLTAICNGSAIDTILNYNINDMYFNNDKFYLADNYNLDLYEKDAHLLSTKSFNSEVLSVYAINNGNQEYVVMGLRDEGCYITLLSDNSFSNDNNNILQLAEGFTIYDIYYSKQNQKLILSAGAKGVLIYNWDGNSLFSTLSLRLMSSYAYTARIYENIIIVATNNGLEIYDLD